MSTQPRSSHTRLFSRKRLDDDAAAYALDPDERHYLEQVLRLEAGAMVELADGSGRLFLGRLDEAKLRGLDVVYEEALPAERIVFASLIKGNRWDVLLEKLAETGASHIVPIEAERSVVTVHTERVGSKLARWQKILDGAARQCERLGRSVIEPPQPLARALSDFPADHTLVLDETRPAASWPSWSRNESVRLGVGPEGGWTPGELALWKAYGAISVGLGANLLRAETAGIAAMVLLRAVDHGLLRPQPGE